MTIYRGPGGAGDATNDAIVNAVAAYATSAASSADNAANSASAASTSATNASTAATNAASSASAAATSASNSAASASTASTQASTATTQANNAAASATAASNSAASASTYASNAASSASTATSKAAEAETYAIRAETAETNAETAYANTLGIFGAATDVANAVAAASTSATNAANSATAAASSATAASGSATTAGNYASAALNSANTANAEASEAQAAANTAVAALQSAQAIYGGLDDVTAAVNEAEDWATQSANSATASSASSSAAQTSANSAATSATNAANSATQSAASAANAAAIVTGVASNRASIRPSLLLDFANTKQLDPRIAYSRASTATFCDGKTVAKAEENLVTNSINLNPAQIVANTLTNNVATAPDGTTTASLLVPNTTNTRHFCSAPYGPLSVAGQAYTYSCFAKAGGYNFVHLQLSSNSTGGGSRYGVTVDLTTGAVEGFTYSSNVTSTSTSVVSIGNGWFRIALTATFSLGGGTTSLYVQSMPTNAPTQSADGLPSYAGNNADGVYFWGFQLEQRSTVTAYTPTTTAPITNYIPALQTAAAGVPRFDHDPITGESKGLLIEEQRSNLLTYSEQFDNASWTKNAATITANTIVAPDGTLTGEKLVEGTTADAIACSRVGVSFTAANTFTIYAKASERRYVFLRAYASVGNYGNVTFDLQTGVVTQTNSAGMVSATGSITSAGNGWYRLSITASASLTAISIVGVLLSNTATPTFTTAGVLASPYTGDGYSGLYIWGAQLEAGSFATSYIPTVASQVTRSADAASMTGTNFSSWFNASEGSIYAEAQTANTSTAGGVFAQIDNGSTTGNRYLLAVSGAVGIRMFSEPSSASAQITPVALGSTYNKIVGSYYSSGINCCVNSSAVQSAAAVYPTGLSRLGIGSLGTSGVTLNGTIKRLAYYPKRLSNSELQGITS